MLENVANSQIENSWAFCLTTCCCTAAALVGFGYLQDMQGVFCFDFLTFVQTLYFLNSSGHGKSFNLKTDRMPETSEVISRRNPYNSLSLLGSEVLCAFCCPTQTQLQLITQQEKSWGAKTEEQLCHGLHLQYNQYFLQLLEPFSCNKLHLKLLNKSLKSLTRALRHNCLW